jgi:hypothetical protein
MKKSALIVGFFLSLFIISCEKVDPEVEFLPDPGTEVNSSQLKSAQVNSSEEINYLLSLIEDIESMVEEGMLSAGNGNALIVKIKNAIKSHENCNTNAASNQLGALINQLEAFINSGILTEEQGELLISNADNGIVLLNPLINTTWDFIVQYSETGFWHADVTFYADGTTRYDEPAVPGLYLSYGTWSMECNTLYYIMDSSDPHGPNYGDWYHFTGTLSGNTMSGTCTFPAPHGPFTWTATLK